MLPGMYPRNVPAGELELSAPEGVGQGVLRNPGGYYKLYDGTWNFDVLNDMIFSFFVLTPIEEHKQKK
eukprot:3770867-Prymnesium_polylepis.1